MEVILMSTNVTLSVLGLYKLDNTIFENMAIPEGVSLDTLSNNILMECAELEVLYPSCDFMKFAIGEWSKKRLPEWEKVKALYDVDLLPDNDYHFTRTVTGNRNKNTDDQRLKTLDLSDRKTGNDTMTNTGSTSTENESSGTSTDTPNLTDETKVAAFNSSTYQDRDKVTHTGTDTVRSSSNGSSTRTDNLSQKSTYNSNLAKTGTEKDSLDGKENTIYTETVTESGHKGSVADFVRASLEITASIYDYICEDFKQRFCLLVY